MGVGGWVPIAFALGDAALLRMRSQPSGPRLAYQLYRMLPHTIALVTMLLVLAQQCAPYPWALIQPFRKGER
jgi:ABC-type uncharacterized transport system permease subunit